jgi:hypothetical protein
VKLLNLLLPHNATLRTLGRRLATLSNYAVDFRYPVIPRPGNKLWPRLATRRTCGKRFAPGLACLPERLRGSLAMGSETRSASAHTIKLRKKMLIRHISLPHLEFRWAPE